MEVYPVALGSQPGIATLWDASTAESLICGWVGALLLLRQTVAVCALDILWGASFAGRRLIIKIDVEGAEYAVLEGGGSIVAMSPRPRWLLEICLSEHHPAGLNPNYARTFERCWHNGYEARTTDKESRIVSPADVKRWLISRPCAFGHNYVFEPKS